MIWCTLSGIVRKKQQQRRWKFMSHSLPCQFRSFEIRFEPGNVFFLAATPSNILLSAIRFAGSFNFHFLQELYNSHAGGTTSKSFN